MSYDIGSFIDLSYLNKKIEVTTVRPKSMFKGVFEKDPGTCYTFQRTAEGIKAALKIPVQVIA